jgi:hypothetical protein
MEARLLKFLLRHQLQRGDRRIEHSEQDLVSHGNPHQLPVREIADRRGIPWGVMDVGNPNCWLVYRDDRNEFGAEAPPQPIEEDGPEPRVNCGVVNLGDQRFKLISHDDAPHYFS